MNVLRMLVVNQFERADSTELEKICINEKLSISRQIYNGCYEEIDVIYNSSQKKIRLFKNINNNKKYSLKFCIYFK